MGFNVKAFTEKLDKIASDVEAIDPKLALEIDIVSDVLEGKKDASALKFDADEARYMADRFNYKVRSRNADEPYMDEYNKSDFSQVSDAYAKMPGHTKAAQYEENEEEVEAKKKQEMPEEEEKKAKKQDTPEMKKKNEEEEVEAAKKQDTPEEKKKASKLPYQRI